jgi:hypothetical protein
MDDLAKNALSILGGKQRWFLTATRCRDELRSKFSTLVYSEKSVADAVLLDKWPAQQGSHSLLGGRKADAGIVESNVIESANIQ